MSSDPIRALLRRTDADIRSEAGVAIVHVETLMRALVQTMPQYESPVETERYLEAVKDIAIQVNAATFRHDSDTGELVRSGETVMVPSEVVTEEHQSRNDR